jgi:hypothetical protein
MTPINSFNDPSIGSIEEFIYGRFLRNIGLAFLVVIVAFGIYKLFFEKKEKPKQNGDDKA